MGYIIKNQYCYLLYMILNVVSHKKIIYYKLSNLERTSCEAKRTDCEVMTNNRKVVRQETGGTPGK